MELLDPPPTKKRDKNSCFAPINPLFHFYYNHLQTNFVNINFNIRKSNEYISTVLYLFSNEKCVLKKLSTVVPFLETHFCRKKSFIMILLSFNGSSHSCLSKEWTVITPLTTLSERCQCIPDHIMYEGCQCIPDHFCLGNWGHCSASQAETL